MGQNCIRIPDIPHGCIPNGCCDSAAAVSVGDDVLVIEPAIVENPQQSDTDDIKGSEDCCMVESWTQSQLYFQGTGGLFTTIAQTLLENARGGVAMRGETCHLNASA